MVQIDLHVTPKITIQIIERRPLKMETEVMDTMEKKTQFVKQESITPHTWLRGRLFIQIGFVVLCIWLGWEFGNFVARLRNDLPVTPNDRPPGVEGFLPISSLMELWLWIRSGIVLKIHPAGVTILSFAILSSLFLRRGFCSWLCPVGTLSESLWRLGDMVGLTLTPYRWLDVALRSFKYVILLFFLYVVLGMSSKSLVYFISGDYNRVSDIKMLDFFLSPSRYTLSVIGILGLLSIVLKYFWCRYLCPYGALLGIISFLSPVKIRRNAESCIDCNKCNKACPSYLPVATSLKIKSVECLACQQCVAACPVRDCLQFSAPQNKLSLKPARYGIVFVLIFLGSFGLAQIIGYWKTSTPVEQLRSLSKQTSHLTHPRDASGY
jgi:polyferredoxin